VLPVFVACIGAHRWRMCSISHSLFEVRIDHSGSFFFFLALSWAVLVGQFLCGRRIKRTVPLQAIRFACNIRTCARAYTHTHTHTHTHSLTLSFFFFSNRVNLCLPYGYRCFFFFSSEIIDITLQHCRNLQRTADRSPTSNFAGRRTYARWSATVAVYSRHPTDMFL
jgi:hypothetical protein